MKRKKIVLYSIVMFYVIILTFTVSARRIHRTSLPKVSVVTLTYESFTTERSLGERSDDATVWNVALPKELYDQHPVFIISNEVINGEERRIAREVTDLILGSSNTSSYEVVKGLSGLDQVIVTGLEELTDGCEVYVEE